MIDLGSAHQKINVYRIPYSEGLHIIVAPKQEVANAWQDVGLASETFQLASSACKIMEDIQMAPWFNLQANGNWGTSA
jgi:hypothetical protein